MMRRSLIWALGVVLAATLWLAQQDDEVTVQPARRGDHPPVAASSAAPTAVTTGARAQRAGLVALNLADAVARWHARADTPASRDDRMAGASWRAIQPPPPPPPPVMAPPPPQAPAFPHRWLGRYQETPDAADGGSPTTSSRPRAIIAGPVSTWVVAEGDTIEGQWRVERVDERSLRLTYLPLMQSQTLTMR